MSEFKFACPVCGQHITADSSSSGGQLDCPTCYRKIIIPQAGSGGSKLIISASQADKPRPTTISGTEPSVIKPHAARSSLFATIAFLLVLFSVAAGAYVFRHKIFKSSSAAKNVITNAPVAKYPIPTNISWTLNLTNKRIPNVEAAGSIHGSGFHCDRAILQGGHLTLRQGSSGPADLGVTVQLFAQQGEDLAGKTIEIAPDRSPPLPKVVLRWKDSTQAPVTHSIPQGYALKVTFDNAANGRVPGKIYLCLPDDEKSFVAGNFDAEIRKPPPPKQKSPKTPKPPGA
jgi:hypothetical protein